MRLLILLAVVAGTPATSQSAECYEIMREAYVGLSIVPVQVSEALTAARADGLSVDAEAAALPEEVKIQTDEIAEGLLAVVDEICR